MTATLTRRQLVGAGAAGAALLATGAVPARAARRRTRRVDVCVIGAGLSGLAAARALVAADRSVAVLEARDRVGGRTLNASLPGGHIAELGGEFAGPTQTHILALAKAVGVKTFPNYDTGSNVQIASGVRSLYAAVPGIPTDPEVTAGLVKVLELDGLAKQAGVAAPWKAKKGREWDRMTHRRWASLPAGQRRAQALGSFAAFLGDAQANAPTEYLERNWVKESWSRGCPVAHLPVGVLTKHGPWLRRPVGRVHFAGSETSEYWIGYMDGAVRAGQRAASEVIAATR